MIRYTVIWRPQAESELTRLWMSAANRSAIAHASDEIDRLLALDPDQQGVADAEGLRRLNVNPLTVLFSVEADDRKAAVLAVRLMT